MNQATHTTVPFAHGVAPRRSSNRRKRAAKVTVRLLPVELGALRTLAHARGLSVADYVRLAALGALPLHAAALTFGDLGIVSISEWVLARRLDMTDFLDGPPFISVCVWCERRGLFVERCEHRWTTTVLGESVCALHDMKVRRLVAAYYDARAAKMGERGAGTP